ncbi:hypothetical protein C7R17_14410 [Staphylococcus aureus]|uniref:hypothetical protein n=1 Tax=Staphylococcus aureus TaxID=1280 RepID=UPI000DAA3F58|nr:hypothetical protein [Staphylococcus aureus]PZH27160.1 hypothetical protein C7R17_14410 [Staphylococcus aureus]
MKKSNFNPKFLKFITMIKGVPKYFVQNSRLIYAILLVILLPFVVLTILLFLSSLNIKNTTLAIFIVIIITSALLTWIYQVDFKKDDGVFKKFNNNIVQFFITIVPITLTLLNTGYTLDQISEQNKSENETTINCVKKHFEKNKYSCEISNPNSKMKQSNFLIINLLLTPSFGTLIVIHNIYKGKHQKKNSIIKYQKKRNSNR